MKRALISILLLAVAVAALADVSEAPDPTRIACGARILGLGKTFVGLSDDVSTIFMNPAGLAQINRWQITSLSGQVMDFNYLTFAGVYPTNFGNVGLGFSGASIGGVYGSKIKDGTQGSTDELYELDYNQVMNYSNNVFLLSYGIKAEQALDQPFLKSVKNTLAFTRGMSVGANLKIFSSGLSGGSITNGSGFGTELDLGLLYPVRDFLNLGFTATNVLPYSLGGKLTYSDSHSESYPVSVKLGASANILGKSNALRQLGDQNLRLLLDLETRPTTARYPMVFHTGVEWSPIQLLTLRLGMDQDAAEDSNGSVVSLSNLTAGVGLTYQMFRFDYAYHAFSGVTGQDNHFFSLTYGLPLETADKEIKGVIKVDDPKDKTITREADTLVKGSVLPMARYVKVNNVLVTPTEDRKFSKLVTLELKKNRISVEALDIGKKRLGGENVRLFRIKQFPDVPANYWAGDQIGLIATLGIIEGYPNGYFKPTGNITRAELTSVLMRTSQATLEAGFSLFKDVRLSHWAAKYIMPAVKTGVVKGYPDNTFRPSANISRAEGLAMIARFSSVTQEAGETPYLDVPASHWAAPIVKGSYRVGMLQYLGQKPFEPNKKLTREEAVEMLFRSPYVQDLLRRDLLNWDTY